MRVTRLSISIGLLTWAVVASAGQQTKIQGETLVRSPQGVQEAPPSFEVATIKPADPSEVNGNVQLGRDRVSVQNQTVASLISLAYGLHKDEIADPTHVLTNVRYDIEAKEDLNHAPSFHQVQEMLQGLLVDRFGLKFHREKRETPVYTLIVRNGAPKITPQTKDASGVPAQTGGGGLGGGGAQITRKFTNNTMEDFALGLQAYLDRPVVDETGLKGRYDFSLTWTPETAESVSSDAAPGLFTAIQEQLGLKLEPSKSLIDVFVVDHVSGPSPD